MTDVSVIIVSWNAKEYLLHCLESVYQQIPMLNGEIIVLDNASSDGSVEAVRKRFPDVRIIENRSNTGFARANNIGIENSNGRYLFFINSDIILRPECTSRLISYMDEHPTVGILGPKILNPDLTLQRSFRPFPTIWNSFLRASAIDTIRPLSSLTATGLRAIKIGAGQEADILSGCFWVVRRAALADVGLLDEQFFMYAEDKDWCTRFWKAGWKVVYLNSAEAIHFGGASSDREPVRFYVEQHRANLYYWKKHHGNFGQIMILAIMLLYQGIRIATGAFVYCFRPSRRPSIRLAMQRCLICMNFLLAAARYSND
jgi:hypothetical protein